jgi:SAM-dependent methyltransferase
MSQSRPTILGTAAGIAAVLDESSICSLYGPEAARIGENLRRRDTVSINDFLAAAEGCSGPILDIGAGTGRLTVPLLDKGHEVIALDLSSDMLDILAERLKQPESQAFADRATLVNADMTDFHLDRTFSLMTMAGAAIWTIDAEQRAKMFQRVGEHLADDGKLVVELVTLDAFVDKSSPAFEQTTVFTLSDNGTPYICTFFDFVNPGEGVRCGSVLAHKVEDGKVSKTLLGTAMSYPVPIPELEQEVERAGLRIAGTREISKDLPGASPLRSKVHVLLVEITK